MSIDPTLLNFHRLGDRAVEHARGLVGAHSHPTAADYWAAIARHVVEQANIQEAIALRPSSDRTQETSDVNATRSALEE